jgi:gluconolactonase
MGARPTHHLPRKLQQSQRPHLRSPGPPPHRRRRRTRHPHREEWRHHRPRRKGPPGPNDLVYAIDGSIYFTDLPRGLVYQITRTGQLRVVAETPAPNGVALSANQQLLYIADVKTQVVRVHTIEPDGRLKPGKDFAPVRVDGLKTDESGNVWMAAPDGIAVYSAAGEHQGTLKVPERPSNCAFYGASFYITARTSVYQIQTKVFGTRTF